MDMFKRKLKRTRRKNKLIVILGGAPRNAEMVSDEASLANLGRSSVLGGSSMTCLRWFFLYSTCSGKLSVHSHVTTAPEAALIFEPNQPFCSHTHFQKPDEDEYFIREAMMTMMAAVDLTHTQRERESNAKYS